MARLIVGHRLGSDSLRVQRVQFILFVKEQHTPFIDERHYIKRRTSDA